MFLIIAAALTCIAFGGLLQEVLDDVTKTIGEHCGDCYRLELLPITVDEELKLTTFSYKLKVGPSPCKQLRYLYLGLDNRCGHDEDYIKRFFTFDFGFPGASDPDPTWAITSDAKTIEIEIDFTHKIDPGQCTTFDIIVHENDPTTSTTTTTTTTPAPGTRPRRGGWRGMNRANTDDTLIAFQSTNQQSTETCYTDVSFRLLPEICPPPRGPRPPPPPPPGNDRRGPGDLKGCESSDANCGTGEVCVGLLDEKNACDGGVTSKLSDENGRLRGAVCIEQRFTPCASDDDCKSQERCYTPLDSRDNTDDATKDAHPRIAECSGPKVCGTTNFNP